MFYNKDWSWLTSKEFKPLAEKFKLKNLKKIQAMRMELWGWHKLPTYNKHYIIDEKKSLIKIPNWLRGFLEFDNKYPNIKKIEHPSFINKYEWNELDLFQNKWVDEMLSKWDVWLLHWTTWIWKSAILAKIISKLEVKTLIIVAWITLMTQMKADLKVFFWKTYKTISGAKTKQKWASEDIVIWNIDSVIKMDKEWLNQFDLVILDEVDTFLCAERRLEFIGSLWAKYIYWLTWTIKLNHVSDKIFPMYIWPKTELLLTHFIPTINKVMTDFKYELMDLKEMHLLKEKLYTNEARNDLIVQTVVSTLQDRKWIIFSEYIEHAKTLKEKLESSWIKCFLLIWEIKKDEREKIKSEIKELKWPCVLIGSVKIIWRGMDIPELSIWYFTTCEKFSTNINQYVWRIIRKFPKKTDAIRMDFIDPWCTLLYNQSKTRSTNYRKAFPWCKINLI